MTGRAAVFLDRDGVLNRAVVRDGRPWAPREVAEFEILPGVPEACRQLRDAGFWLVVTTNQPEVARGFIRPESLEAMHQVLRSKVPVDDIRVCFHASDGECQCRKPLPGLLLDAARDWRIDLEKSFMVGDRWRDIDAGHAAGCRTLFIDYGYSESLNQLPDWRVHSLPEATAQILAVSR